MSKELETISNEDLLAVVDEIVATEEIAKSQKSSQEAAAMANIAAPAETEVEKSAGNVSTPADGGAPVDGPGPGESVDAVKDGKKKKKQGELGTTEGELPQSDASVASTGGSEDVANPKSEGGMIAKSQTEMLEKMMKSIETVASAVATMSKRIEAVEAKSAESMKKSITSSEEEIRKSVTAEVAERLSKSYIGQIDEMKKANAAVITEAEELRKSNAAIMASNQELKTASEELQKSLKKPADTRAAIRNVDVVEKSTEATQGERIFKSKSEVCDALEELRKSGKVTGDEVISYNVSNILSDNAKRLLKKS